MSSPFDKVTAISPQQSAADGDMETEFAASGISSEFMSATAQVGPGSGKWPDETVALESKIRKQKRNMREFIKWYWSAPYFNPDGTVLMYIDPDGNEHPYIVRKPYLKPGSPQEFKERKYLKPSKWDIQDEILATVPYLHPARLEIKAAILDFHEGEKKCACAVFFGQVALGIGGCDSWRDPTRKGKIHPWILDEIRRMQKANPGVRLLIRLWPDGDFKDATKDVGRGYAGLVAQLRLLDVDVVLMDLTEAYGLSAKFDDLVGLHGYAEVMSKAVQCDPSILPENLEDLIRRYSLL
ncbi:MAG: hypothetical protein EON54_08645, partial [Alcaligenaceae bacterium]